MSKSKNPNKGYSNKTCVFCGKTPRTQEELFPYWVRSLVPDESPVKYTMQMTNQIGRFQPRFRTELYQRTGRASSKQIKEFCGTCNNGWMSTIERESSPVLTPIILKENKVLDQEEIKQIIKWATLRVIVMDVAEPVRVIRQATRQKFYSDKLPVENLTIWLGVSNTDHGYYFATESTRYSKIISISGQINTRSYLWMGGGLLVYAIYSEGFADFSTLYDAHTMHLVKLSETTGLVDTSQLIKWDKVEINILRHNFLELMRQGNAH